MPGRTAQLNAHLIMLCKRVGVNPNGENRVRLQIGGTDPGRPGEPRRAFASLHGRLQPEVEVPQVIDVRQLAATDDATAAGRLVQEAYFAVAGYPRDAAYDAVLGDVAGRAQHATVVVAVDADARVLGCLTYVPDAANPYAEHGDAQAASFRCFGVARAAQGMGVGRAMAEWCVAEARRTGKTRLRIHTLTMMHGAQCLYESMGFQRDPRHDADWDGTIGLAYVLHLGPAQE